MVGIASRKLEKAEVWAEKFNIPKAFGSYQALLDSDEIDAVYIPLPTTLHKEWATAAARAGKHVLCEKPVGVAAAEVEEIVAACAAARVQFMDGVMFMHHRRLGAVRARLADREAFGEVRHVGLNFCFSASPEFAATDIRFDPACEPLGCLGDLGWYCVRFALWVYEWEKPEAVTCIYHTISDKGSKLPTSCTATLKFQGGKSAGFHCSFESCFTQTATIFGVHQRLDLDDFVLELCPERTHFTHTLTAGLQDTARRVVTESETHHVEDCCQEVEMIKTFADLVIKVKEQHAEPELSWGNYSLQTQQVLDACIQSADRNGLLVNV